MKPLNCLTLFLRTGKKFKLESGETADELARDNQIIDYQASYDESRGGSIASKTNDEGGSI